MSHLPQVTSVFKQNTHTPISDIPYLNSTFPDQVHKVSFLAAARFLLQYVAG